MIYFVKKIEDVGFRMHREAEQVAELKVQVETLKARQSWSTWRSIMKIHKIYIKI